jgi:hypothetical protein
MLLAQIRPGFPSFSVTSIPMVHARHKLIRSRLRGGSDIDSCPPLVKEKEYRKIINTIKKSSFNTSTYPVLEYYEETVC